MAKNKLAENDLYQMLQKRYAEGGWALFPQVYRRTGNVSCRIADAVAMSTWPSRGLEMHGFEIKVSRSDWLRELEDVEKADEIFQFCDRWWIVASVNVVAVGELPPTWGLMEPRGASLRTTIAAPKLEPKPLDKPFLAAVLRRAAEFSVPDTILKKKLEEKWTEGYDSAEKTLGRRIKGLEKSLEVKKKLISDFEKKSGVNIDRWDLGNVAEAVRIIKQAGTPEKLCETLEKIAEPILRIHDRISKQIEKLRAIEGASNEQSQ